LSSKVDRTYGRAGLDARKPVAQANAFVRGHSRDMQQATRSVLITGCSSGIGYDAARTLKQRGWRVIATARKVQDLARLRAELDVETVGLELSDAQSVATAADEVLRLTGGRLDALYNNAAYGVIGAMEDVSVEVLRRHFEVNVFGVHDLTRRFIPAMRAAGHGRIVNCSSVLGLVSGPYRGPYCATKFALEAISDALRQELAGSGIHVAVLQPGPIRSRFMDTTLATFKANIDVDASPHRAQYATRIKAMENDTASKLKLGPEAVVKALVHALESPRPKARYRISPHTHAVVWAKRLLPTRAVDLLMARS
jgi:NAD(P)-dependent dehydrogenase (short-subunit alcohol dehydrogenase family)